MERAHLSPPTFESDRDTDQFIATFLMHHFLDKQDIEWLAHFKDAHLSDDEARILIHAREIGFVNNFVCRYYTKLDTLGASNILRRLRDIGLLEQHPHASATYYTPTDRLLRPETSEGIWLQKNPDKKTTLLDFPQEGMKGKEESSPPMGGAVPAMSGSLPTMPGSLPAMLGGLPADLLEEIWSLGQRSPPARIKDLIARLCGIQSFTADELAKILQRNKKWVKSSYLAPMIRDGVIEYTIPEHPQHPNQAYRTKKL